MDKEITTKSLIDAGVHLGHKRESWNPKMEPYIFGERKGICVIDPEKTLALLMEAGEEVKKIVVTRRKALFVGTKRQIANTIKEEALRCGAFYCTRRWLGGTLTNFVTIRKSVEKLKLLEEQRMKNADNLTKKEKLIMDKQMEKMHKNLDGIIEMDELPGIIYITDIRKERIVVREAIALNIPIVAIVDTNTDPTIITYPVPANDDAIRSVRLITNVIADSILEGQQEDISGEKG